jgi:transposase
MSSFHPDIDIVKAKFACALRLPNGKFRGKSLPNTTKSFAGLDRWLDQQGAGTLHVCMEATDTYREAVAEHLALAGHPVSVVNPFQIKSFAQSCPNRGKTDAGDARPIARFCAERQPEPWQAPSASEQTLKALAPRLDALRATRVQEGNRLDVSREAVRGGIVQHIDCLDEQIDALVTTIRQHIDRAPEMKDKRDLLDSIQNPVGGVVPPTAGGNRQTPDAHHRRHDAKTRGDSSK